MKTDNRTSPIIPQKAYIIERSIDHLPMRDASSRWVRQSTWSMGVTAPSLAVLLWILSMLATLDSRITAMVHPIVLSVAGPLPVCNWSKHFITSSLNGPISTNNKKAAAASPNSTKNNNWIISSSTSSSFKKTQNHYRLQTIIIVLF